MKNRLARSFSGSVMEADASIRQNITAWVVGLRHALEAVVVRGRSDRCRRWCGAAAACARAACAAPRSWPHRRGLRLGGGQLLLQALDLGLARPPQRHAPAQALAHGARAVEPGGRPVGGEAGARQSCGAFRSLSLTLIEVGQLQIVEEQVEELFLGEREGELVLALAVGAALAAAPAAAALRLGDLVADLVFLVARQHVVALAGVAAEREGGLAQALGADGDLLRAFGLGDLARLERVLDRLADLGLGAAQEPLAIAEALGFRIEAPVDDLHLPCPLRPLRTARPGHADARRKLPPPRLRQV